MKIVLDGIVLATDTSRVVGLPTGLLIDSHACSAIAQESNPIRSHRRKLYPRKQQSGAFKFTVSIRYGSLAESGEACILLPRQHAGLYGDLQIIPLKGATVPISGAHIASATAVQDGVSIDVTYEVEY